MTEHRFRSARRAAATGAVLTAAVLVLAACGGQDPAGHDSHGAGEPAATADRGSRHNSADVTFAQGMIPHHRQAVEMAALVTGRSDAPQVKKLAKAVEKAQNPEIRTMSGWLRSWGEKVPGADHGTDHSGHGTAGMMSAEDMARLEKASGREFDRAFLEMMIEHHRGAVRMARAEKSSGAHRPSRTMAGDVITSQSAEIAQMKDLLDR